MDTTAAEAAMLTQWLSRKTLEETSQLTHATMGMAMATMALAVVAFLAIIVQIVIAVVG